MAALLLVTGSLLGCANDSVADGESGTETGDGDGDPTGDGDGDPTGDGDGDPTGDGDGDPTGDGDGDPTGDGDGDGDSCGDGVLDEGEGCDNGAANSDDAECTSSCQLATCGDGLVYAGVEACDGGGETIDCNADCSVASCGDNILNVTAGEACDDGNDLDDDDCVAGCVAASCGDGFIWAGSETCDDGNQVDDDGCSATCAFEVLGQVFLTSSNGSVGFYSYDIEANAWSTLTNPPVTTYSQITNDGELVYLMGVNNTVYAYDVEQAAWSNLMPGPGSLTSAAIGYFQWFDEGFYYLKDGQSTMYVYRNGAWTNFNLGGEGSCAGTWDQATGELYIRTYDQLGFRVVDTSNDTVVRTIVDTTSVGENSRTGSYWNGNFYGRTWDSAFQRLDAQDGSKQDTGATPGSEHTGTDTDFSTGLIYVSGYGGQGTVFQVFDPSDDSITTLANQPMVDNHSTITVMRIPQL
jgi:cysteine-rich repeat protein